MNANEKCLPNERGDCRVNGRQKGEQAVGRDKDFSRNAILKSAKRFFLESGFEKASMRAIAREAKLTVGALYKYFDSKSALFEALVEPALQGMLEQYGEELAAAAAALEHTARPEDCCLDLESTSGVLRILDYIYEHFDAFDLMFNRSQGTKYEHMRDFFVDMEITGTKKYIQVLEEKGLMQNPFTEKELHIFCTLCMTPLFEVINHRYQYDEAVNMVKLMSYGQCCAWNHICRLKETELRGGDGGNTGKGGMPR